MNNQGFLEAVNIDSPYLLEISSEETEIEILIASYDFPSIFSLLCGTISSLGVEISSAEIATVRPGTKEERRSSLPGSGRKILDRFTGRLNSETSLASFRKRLTDRLKTLLMPLATDKNGSAIADSRRTVNHWVAEALDSGSTAPGDVLLPMRLEIEREDPDYTWIALTAQDTHFFLYSVATAVTLLGLSIERVEISTEAGKIRDRLALVDQEGKRLESERVLNRLRFSILLTKQFTFFLGEAPDPYAAIIRFESMIEELSRSADLDRWRDMLENPRTLKELAKLLGMSDFLWEEFIRLQYENILPLLSASEESAGSLGMPVSREDFEYRLQVALSKEENYEARKRRLNKFKDEEIYRLDLEQIIRPGEDFLRLSRNLTLLAEAVVTTAFNLAEDELTRRFGRPLTVAGIEASYAVLGLGKLGGQALGYASDIELLCVYSDNGRTDGAKSIPNSEFFDRLVKEATGMIAAKQEGIFHIDLRLRPHGSAGPHASSLERFADYYRSQAHSFEKLALVRLRAFTGSEALGSRVELLRDEIIYAPAALDLESLRSLRQKQLKEKSLPGRINAKFSSGALVDVEYTVQILQAIHGGAYPALRTPSIHRALDELSRRGIIRSDESQEIVWAYRFLRRLINALRMLRGSAKDLYLPPVDSDEYSHLARRMGYRGRPGLSPREQLRSEFDERSARVRGFVEHYLGRESLPSAGSGTIADLILFPDREDVDKQAILAGYGFANPDRGIHNFESLAAKAGDRDLFARVAVLAVHELASQSDPDMALNNWERLADEDFPAQLDRMLSQPTRISLLMQLLSGSQYLSDTLIANRSLFSEITDPNAIGRAWRSEIFLQRLRERSESARNEDEFIAALREQKKRELLRIGTRDICYHAPLEEITAELSATAEAQITVALERAWKETGGEGEPPYTIGAFGKLGGNELNYSSDLDLVGIAHRSDLPPETGRKLMEQLRRYLASPSPFGAGYRIDYRLRPFGRSGNLAVDIPALEEYYRKHASPWEHQALLKLRLIAAPAELTREFEKKIRPLILTDRPPAEIVGAVLQNRETAIKMNRDVKRGLREIKNGPGGIRDIEFLLQALQLIHAPEKDDLLSASSLDALERLQRGGYLTPLDRHALESAYRLLRRTEHFLQLYDDRQLHSLPTEPEKLAILAGRCANLPGSEFTALIETETRRVLRIRDEYFGRYREL